MDNLVLFIAWGTGGSEIFKEVLSVKTLEFPYLVLTCSDYAERILPGAERVQENEVMGIINKIKPKLVVTERSNGVEFHNSLTRECIKKGIKMLAVTDFYFPKVSDYNKIFNPKPHMVTSVSKLGMKELKKIGFHDSQIFKLGNPSYKKLEDIIYTPAYSNTPRAIYTSQGGDGNLPHTENIDTFTKLYRYLESEFEDFSIDIKLHPMELSYRDKWETDTAYLPKAKVMGHVAGDKFLREQLNSYDMVLGYHSTLQIQAQLLGVPTIFTRDDILYKIGQYKKGVLGKDRNEYISIPSDSEIEYIFNSIYKALVERKENKIAI